MKRMLRSRYQTTKIFHLTDENNYYPIGISLRTSYVCTQEMTEFISLIKTN